MGYSNNDTVRIIQKIIAKVTYEVQTAAANGTLQDVMDAYGITIEDDPVVPVNHRTSKVLVLGALAGKISDYQMAAKKLGVSSDNLEFISDYHKIKHFNSEMLRDSLTYSDIIYGPSPHKIEGMGDTSSLLAEIKRNPTEYPKLIKAEANESLKITISNFKKALRETRYYESEFC